MSVVLTSGGSTLATTTTNSSGQYSAAVSITGTVTVTATVTPLSGRFAVTAASAGVTAGTTGHINVTLSPGSGYSCLAGCQYPVSKTLTISIPALASTGTLTWDLNSASLSLYGANSWANLTLTGSYPGGFSPFSCAGTGTPCPAGTINYRIGFRGSPGTPYVVPQTAMQYQGTSGGGVCNFCPGSASGLYETAATGETSFTCPGASTAATYVWHGYIADQLNYGTTWPFTVSE